MGMSGTSSYNLSSLWPKKKISPGSSSILWQWFVVMWFIDFSFKTVIRLVDMI